MTAQATLTGSKRQESIDRYVILDAIDLFFIHLLNPQRAEPVLANLWPPAVMKVARKVEFPAQLSRELGKVMAELWPGEATLDDPEFAEASRRTNRLAARMLLWAAARPDVFAAEASQILLHMGGYHGNEYADAGLI